MNLRKSIGTFNTIITAFVCLLLPISVWAQPANDNCSSATDLTISNSGFGIDVINSGNIALNGATIQFGEPWHSTMISAGNDKQSIWFRFTLPTTRAVRVTLGQPGTAINEADVGFSVYKTATCLPTLSDLGPAKLTTVNKFGNTFNECLTSGDYLIQVGSKSGITDSIFIELTTGYPFESVSFDYGATAYDYGTLTSGYLPNATGVMMDLGCYSVDSIAEMACTDLGANYQEYGQTIYQVFTTDNFIDALRFELRGLQPGIGNVGIKIFEGDIRSNNINTLNQVGDCHVVNATTAWNGFNELCTLLPNTIYTFQISVHKDVDAKNLMTRISHRGIGITQGSNPANLPSNNTLGILSSSPGGTTTSANDVFSCNAFIDSTLCGPCNIADTNICGSNNPSGGVNVNGQIYELATWYTFTLSGDADIVINTQNYTYKRLFSGDVESDCNLPLFSQWSGNSYTYNCIPNGTYSLQILGNVAGGANLLNTTLTQLGSTANVSINVSDLVTGNLFDLEALGAVDSINGLNPLQDGVNNASQEETFGCPQTVLPDNISCGGQDKASYRIIEIGDADGDFAADSGILTISGGNYYLTNNFFSGDASALAAAQSYPSGTLTGLTDMMGCENFYYSKKVCVTPGTYTLATYAQDNVDVGRTDQPNVQFDIVQTVGNSAANASNLGDITATINSGTFTHSDIFDCHDNPVTIDGLAPCGDKLIYREFQITSPVLINIVRTGRGNFRLFEGQASSVGDAGLSIYPAFGTNCLTNWNQGNCTWLEPGWYTLVVYGSGGSYEGPNYEAGDIGFTNTINISTIAPAVVNYDHDYDNYDYGTITGWYQPSSNGVSMPLGCYTIDSTAEIDCISLPNASEYTQTIYQTFTTDDFIDALRFEAASSGGNITIGVRLFEGDITTDHLSTLTQIGDCHVLTARTRPWWSCSNWDWEGFNVQCLMKPNTTYTVQIVAHESVDGPTLYSRISHVGIGITQGHDPSDLPANNTLGVLPSSPGGSITSGNDVFSCISFIDSSTCGECNIPDTNVCGLNNPAGGVVANAQTYELAVWYTFTVAADADLVLNTPCGTWKRLFNGDVTSNCSLGMFSEFSTTNYRYGCFPAGTYSLQILGNAGQGVNLLDAPYQYYCTTNCELNHLGDNANITIRLTDINAGNYFNLASIGRVDSVNNFDPMPDGIQVPGGTEVFGCSNTVLPAGQSCGGTVAKASYHILNIGDSDGDGDEDEGILTISGTNFYLSQNFYQGDASALAASQGYPNSTITGLTDMMGCENFYYSKKVCVTPGNYTLVTFANNADDIGRADQPRFQFDQVSTAYSDPAAPYNYGDITAAILSGSVTNTDIFDCHDNPVTIDGYTPCNEKLIYREFQITSPVLININSTGRGAFRLFEGRVSAVGTAGLNLYAPFNASCRTSWNQGNCTLLPAGWYTIVTYGTGGDYDGPDYENGDIGFTNTITISTITPPPAPNYNEPGKAYSAGTTDYGPNAGTAAQPDNSRTYTFGTETFGCLPDTPFVPSPGGICDPQFNRVAYYTFTLTNESYINFTGIPSSMRAKLFNLDVRTSDSTLMSGTTPIQSCIQTTDIVDYNHGTCTPTWDGRIEVCEAQPGTYTLVLLASDIHFGSTVTPVLYVDRIEPSQHDRAWNAYDFGIVPGDGSTYYKNGTLNDTGLVAGRNGSNDFISCLTGASSTDPITSLCYEGDFPTGGLTSIDYGAGSNYATYDGLSTTNTPVRRNLWYTFQIDGAGSVVVNVRNLTPGKTEQVPFAVYKSDETYTGSFDLLKAGSGDVDSTLAQGLTLVGTNKTLASGWWCSGCGTNRSTVSFSIPACEDPVTERYYVVVDHNVYNQVTNQIDVGVRYIKQAPIEVKYDYYEDANVINGLNEVYAPYTSVALDSGTYVGDTATFACATPDQILTQYGGSVNLPCNVASQNSLWYKFESNTSGKIRINYSIVGSGTYFNAANAILYKEIIPGDSTEPGLEPIPLSAITSGGQAWGEGCLNLGTYYLVLTGCSYDVEFVVPRIWLLPEPGDLCSNAVPVVLNGAGSSSGTLAVDCHTIGEAFGEDATNPNMGCLFGPTGYKSSWFKVTLTGNLKLDLTFSVSESTTAFASEIRYRMLYGNCDAMTSGPCNADGGTSFTLNCMQADSTDYYVQVVTPENATGTITLNITGVVTANQSCEPLDPNKPIANFIASEGCMGDSICFSNMSTAGENMSYFWNFDDGDTSSEMNPCHLYDSTGNEQDQYNVWLIVTNDSTGAADTVIIPVYNFIPPNPNITKDPPFDADTATTGTDIYFHSNVTDTSTSPVTSYYWTFGDGNTADTSDPIHQYSIDQLGEKYVTLTVTNGSCTRTAYDTVILGSEAIFQGGFNDGHVAEQYTAGCAEVFAGGFFDGHDVGLASVGCGEVFAGGFFDGHATDQLVAGCAEIFAGGFFDGHDMNLSTAGCAEIFAGGFFDGHDVNISTGGCAEMFAGGFYDGHDVSQSNITITVNGEPTDGTDSICVGDTLVIKIDTSTLGTHTILWSTGSTNDSIIVGPTITTTYTVTDYIDNGSCTDTLVESVTVYVFDTVSVDAGADQNVCAGSSAVIGTFDSDPQHFYTWTPALTLNDSTLAQPTATPTDTTTYFVTISNADGFCNSDSDSVTLFVSPLPVITSISNDTVLCAGALVDLIVVTTADHISWHLNDTSTASIGTNDTMNVAAAGTYYAVAYNDGCGTRVMASVNVSYRTAPIADAGSDTSVCTGISTTLGTASLFAYHAYAWDNGMTLSDSTIDQPVASITTLTTYQLIVSDNMDICPPDTDYVTVSIKPDPVINSIIPDTLICSGDSITLFANTTSDNVSWYQTDTTNLISTADTARAGEFDIYIVKAFNNSCTAIALDTMAIGNGAGVSGTAYRTRQDGDWTDLNTWQIYNIELGIWEDATAYSGCGGAHYPTSWDSTILVQDSVIYDFTITQGIDQTTISTTGIIVIPAGNTLYMVDSSSSSIPVDIDNDGKIYVTGVFTQVGTALLDNDHNSTVIYNGVNQNMWNGQYGMLHVDGGGIKTVTGTLTSATNDVLFINGHILLGNRNFRLWDIATTSGASTTTGWFITNAFGSVYKMNVGSTNVLTYNFEVGTSATSFNRLMVTNNGTTDNYRIRVEPQFNFDNDYACDALTDSSSVDRTWYISEDVALGSDLSIDAYWSTPHENVWFNRSESYVGEYQSGNGWVQIGTMSPATASGTQYYQSASNITEPYAYAVGSCLGDKYMYRTISDGVWTDVNIWEIYIPALAGWYPASVAPCTCGPADYPTSADSTIWVRHYVDFDQYITIGVDELIIEDSGTVVMDQDTFLLVDGATPIDMENYGKIILGEAGMRLVTAPTWVNHDSSVVHYNWENQTVFPVTYGHLWIDGPSALPVLSIQKTLGGAGTYVRNDLKFMRGILNLGDNDILMDDSANVFGAHADTGWADATGLGYFIWDYPTGTNITRFYPLGGQYYSWTDLNFQNITGAGTLGGRVREFDHPLAPGIPIHRFWTMTQQTMTFSGTYDIRVNYDDFDLPYTPVDDADELSEIEVAGVYSPAYTQAQNWRLSSQGDIAYIPDVTINQGLITNDAFSDFTLMRFVSLLPFEKLDFEGRLTEPGSYLYWTTYHEYSNYGFDLERSVDGSNFEPIAFIPSAVNPQEEAFYDYVDQDVYELGKSVVYYRLKQIDLNGKVTYSKVVAIPIPEDTDAQEDQIVSLYPNPTKRNWETIVLYDLHADSDVVLQVYDVLGQAVYQQSYESLARGKYELKIPTSDLAPGTYIVRMISENNRSAKKLIIVE